LLDQKVYDQIDDPGPFDDFEHRTDCEDTEDDDDCTFNTPWYRCHEFKNTHRCLLDKFERVWNDHRNTVNFLTVKLTRRHYVGCDCTQDDQNKQNDINMRHFKLTFIRIFCQI